MLLRLDCNVDIEEIYIFYANRQSLCGGDLWLIIVEVPIPDQNPINNL